MKRYATAFKVLSRVSLTAVLLLAWVAPAAYADETTCEATDTGYDCTIYVDVLGEGPTFTYTLSEASTVEIITYTSMTCDDWDNAPHAFAADPIIYVYNDQGTLLFSDDDSAAHNDGSNLCWDSYLNLVDLAAGTYTLHADAYDEDHLGTYTLEVSGGSWTMPVPTPTPSPTPTPEPTPTPTVEPTPTPVPTVTPVPPTPTPTPEATPTPEPTPTITPVPTPTTTPEPTPTLVPEPTPTAEPTPTPIPEPSPTPIPTPEPTIVS